MALARMGLERKGYPARVIRAALSRARGTAYSRVQDVNPEMRDRAFLDTLIAELPGCEAWIIAELGIKEAV
jgi:hypothetical protein